MQLEMCPREYESWGLIWEGSRKVTCWTGRGEGWRGNSVPQQRPKLQHGCLVTTGCEEGLALEDAVGNEHTAQLGGFWNEQVGRPDLDLEALNVLLGKADFSLEQEGATEGPWIKGHNPFNVTRSGCS